MKSMALSKQERKPQTMKGLTDRPKYPWGLEVRLDQATLAKLGKHAADFTVGDDVRIVAKADVVSVSSEETRGAKKREAVTLQITAMEVDGDDYSKAMGEALKKGEKK